jgi:hypothetical protein
MKHLRLRVPAAVKTLLGAALGVLTVAAFWVSPIVGLVLGVLYFFLAPLYWIYRLGRWVFRSRW